MLLVPYSGEGTQVTGHVGPLRAAFSGARDAGMLGIEPRPGLSLACALPAIVPIPGDKLWTILGAHVQF